MHWVQGLNRTKNIYYLFIVGGGGLLSTWMVQVAYSNICMNRNTQAYFLLEYQQIIQALLIFLLQNGEVVENYN